MAIYDVVIGLDLATQTGWSVYSLAGDLIDSGFWDLALTEGEHEGWRWNRLNQHLTQLLGRFAGRVAAIGVEGAFSSPTQEGGKQGMSKRSTAVLWGLRAIVESVAALHRRPDGIPVVELAQSTVKMVYAGNGRSTIAKVIEVAERERPLKMRDNGTERATKLRSDEAIARGVAKTLIDSHKVSQLRSGRVVRRGR